MAADKEPDAVVIPRPSGPANRHAGRRSAIVVAGSPLVGLVAAVALVAGAAVDVAGLRRWELVVRRHPRADFKRQFRAAFGAHAEAAPRCRVHTLLRYGLFGPMIRHAPFDE